MSVFDNYARYYDLLYGDKDYHAEADYIGALIDKYAPAAKSILDLGCGTGRHAILLATKGWDVLGVDLSEEMVTVAHQRLQDCNEQTTRRVDFQTADIRTLNLPRKFDTVLALFHVLSYQTTNEDLAAAFSTAKAHLDSNGVFIFDFWYGPAVLSQKPEVRSKRAEDDDIIVERQASPQMFYNDNCVEVNYELKIRDKSTHRTEELRQCHRMRYLFLPEVRQMVNQAGMKLIFTHQWLTGKAPGPDTWGLCCGAIPQS